MEDFYLKILLTIFGAVISAGIGYIAWKLKSSETKETKRREEKEKEEKENLKEFEKTFYSQRDDLRDLQIHFNILQKNWEEKNVDKAYDSAKRSHKRHEETKKELSDLKKIINQLTTE